MNRFDTTNGEMRERERVWAVKRSLETRGNSKLEENFVRFRLGEILNDKPRGRSEFPRIHLG